MKTSLATIKTPMSTKKYQKPVLSKGIMAALAGLVAFFPAACLANGVAVCVTPPYSAGSQPFSRQKALHQLPQELNDQSWTCSNGWAGTLPQLLQKGKLLTLAPTLTYLPPGGYKPGETPKAYGMAILDY